MTDEQGQNGMQPGRYDDDRLLACALGFDDDPELLEAAEADAELGARLAAARADVAAVGAKVSAAVPSPEEGYTDLSGDRWGGLAEYLQAPAPAKARGGRRWWRVVAPVAAIAVVALVAGVALLNQGGSGVTASSDEMARSASDTGVPLTGSGAGAGATKALVAERVAQEIQRFAVVVLAQARQATGALQQFAVVRIFKGDAPEVVVLDVDDVPADQGRLHLLMLNPTATATPAPVTGSTASPETWSASPEPSLPPFDDAADAYGEPLFVTYTYHGEPTMVREFAAGTDPTAVVLPLP